MTARVHRLTPISVVRRFQRRHGIAWTAFAGALAAAAASALLCYAVYLAFGWRFTPMAVAMPIVVPLLLAPGIIVLLAGALSRLGELEHVLDRALAASGVVPWDIDAVTGEVELYEDWLEARRSTLGPTARTTRDWFERVPAEEREAVLAAAQQTQKGQTDEYAVEYRMRGEDGEWRWVLTRGRVTVRDPQTGRALRMSGTNVDITGRKRAEEALRQLNDELEQRVAARTAELRQSLSLLQSTLDASADGILVLNLEGRVAAYNRRFLEMWGVPESLANGGDNERLIEFVRDQLTDPVAFAAAVQHLRARPEEIRDDTYVFKDGRTFERHSRPQLRDGEIVGRVSSFRDVTARKRAEHEAALALERLRLATEVARTYSWIWEVETDTLTYLTSAEALLGPRPPGGRYPDFRDMVHPEDRPAYLAMSRRLVAELGDYEREFRIVRTDGGTRWLLGRGSAYKDRFTGTTYMVGVTTDITERRQAEEAIRNLNVNLEKRVEERTAELRNALRELESFSYSVSHDLRAPARAVAGFSRIVIDDYGAQLPEEGRRLLGRISKAGEAMGAMVDGLLELSRITRTELSRRPVDLAELAAEVWRELADLERGRRVEFHVEDRIYAEGDPILLRNLLANLLGNARKFTRHRPDAAVWLGRSATGEFCIRDNGAGFDMKYAAKLFDAFQRMHSEREFEGHGIGLALAKKIVERHGGAIRAEAAPGQGAAFFFTLGSARPAPPIDPRN